MKIRTFKLSGFDLGRLRTLVRERSRAHPGDERTVGDEHKTDEELRRRLLALAAKHAKDIEPVVGPEDAEPAADASPSSAADPTAGPDSHDLDANADDNWAEIQKRVTPAKRRPPYNAILMGFAAAAVLSIIIMRPVANEPELPGTEEKGNEEPGAKIACELEPRTVRGSLAVGDDGSSYKIPAKETVVFGVHCSAAAFLHVYAVNGQGVVRSARNLHVAAAAKSILTGASGQPFMLSPADGTNFAVVVVATEEALSEAAPLPELKTDMAELQGVAVSWAGSLELR